MTTAAGGALTTSKRLLAHLTFSSPGPPSADPHQSGLRRRRSARRPRRQPAVARHRQPVQRREVGQQPAHHPDASRHSRHLQQPQRVATEEPDRLARRVGQPPPVRTSSHASPSLHIRPRQELQATTASLVWSDPRCSNASRSAVPASTCLQARHARATTTSPCVPGARAASITICASEPNYVIVRALQVGNSVIADRWGFVSVGRYTDTLTSGEVVSLRGRLFDRIVTTWREHPAADGASIDRRPQPASANVLGVA